VQYRVLGPLEVWDGRRAIPMGGPKQRLVLANLLIRANQVVAAEGLIEEIWGEQPPETGANALQTYVSRLRRALGAGCLESRPRGYVLRAQPEEVDSLRFEALVREARDVLPGDPGAALTKLEEAQALWRGPAFADLAGEPSLRGEIARLEELRLSANEHRVAAELALGRASTVVGRLEVLTDEHPLRERLWAHLMVALYRCGRQGEAVAAYHKAKGVLAEELGIDPSPELQILYQQILTQDPSLNAPAPAAPVARPAPRHELVPGTIFAGYRIESVIARGGMSTVYLAEHLGLRRPVALKLISSHLAEDGRFRERFIRESQTAASIDHPNVIPIYEAGEAKGRLFIAMRYVDGVDLRTLLRARGRLDARTTISVVGQVAGALDSAHARGLVHRDVKPANMLISSHRDSEEVDHVYLSDFGLTRQASSGSGITGEGQFAGTLDYAAPEQFEGQALDGRTDVYSLGCVLYECLVGHPPFSGETDATLMYSHLMEPPPRVTDERPDLPDGIDHVVATALAKGPDARFASAGALSSEVAQALESPAEGLPSGRRAWRRRPPRRRRRPAAIGAGVVVVAVALVAATLQIVDGGEASRGFRPGIAIVDLQTGEQRSAIPISVVGQPRLASYAEGAFWVQNADPLTFAKIDPDTGHVLKEIVSPADEPVRMSVYGDTLWATGPDLVKIDIGLGREVDRFELGDWVSAVVAAEGSLWATVGDGTILRLDPATGEVEERFDHLPGSGFPIYGAGSIWAAGVGGVSRIDPATGAVTNTELELPQDCCPIVEGGGFGWTSDPTKGVVYKIDRTGQVVATYQTGQGARVGSYSGGMVWIGNSDEGTVVGIDVVNGARRTFRFDHPIQGLAAASDVLLVSLAPGRTYEDRINALKGKVAKLLIPLYALELPDPAIMWGWDGFWVESATCAKLLNYPDAPAPEGWELRPEVAASMPEVSSDGRTYTFTIRRGYWFSPPSNDPVTAETFRYSIERALSPRVDGPGPGFISDIEGEAAFREGKTDHISGLRAEGDVLAIKLTQPSPNFLQRLALPWFCPVPTDSPFVPGGAGAYVSYPGPPQPVPAAGPYYIADQLNGEYAILKRNPNYAGPRPQAFDAIALREGIDPTKAVGLVQDGSWDGIIWVEDPVLAPEGPVAQKYGAEGYGAGEAAPRYYDAPLPVTGFVGFNAGRALFSEPDVRRAAALVVDRNALAAEWRDVPSDQLLSSVWSYVPTDQLLPPVMPGFEDRNLYPLGGSVEKARLLVDGRTRTAVMAVSTGCDPCRREAGVVRANLAGIGIDVQIRQFPDPFAAAREPDANIDLLGLGTNLYYADSASFLEQMLLQQMPRSWLPKGVASQVEGLSRLDGVERRSAAVALADRLATNEVPVAAAATPVVPVLLGPRLGCPVFSPWGFGIDLAALCLEPGA
jgi:DNA-binding SARP family transcriptional activator/ABC-type transport system substrate-binding protein/outer membrane protein assembly factor BamB